MMRPAAPVLREARRNRREQTIAMTIGPGTKADIERAIRQFDGELRDTPDWADWESNNNYKYALLRENGQRYP